MHGRNCYLNDQANEPIYKMENSKLVLILQQFSKEELSQLYDFVQSPYFNKNEEVVQLYAYLKSKAPHFPPRSIIKEKVYAVVFPNKSYDRKHLNYLMNFLLKVIEQFMAIQKYEQRPFQQAIDLLECFLNPKLSKHYQYQYRKIKNSVDQQKILSTSLLWAKFRLAEIAELHFQTQAKRSHDHRLQELADTLDQYYLVKKLQYGCEMLNREKMITQNYDYHLLDEVVAFLRQAPSKEPLSKLYFQLFEMLKNEQESQLYNPLESQLLAHQQLLELKDQKTLFNYLINYCIRKIRNGERQFVHTLLDLYVKGIDEAILLENGKLSPWTFKNIVKLGLATKRFEWTESFVKSYLDKLPFSFRDDALHYNMANLNFMKGNYADAMQHLNQVEFSDIYYSLDSKVLLLKMYFEQNEVEALFALGQSFQTYLRRNKTITSNIKSFYLNFIQVLLRISKLPYEGDPKTVIAHIEKTSKITDRDWLLAKVRQDA